MIRGRALLTALLAGLALTAACGDEPTSPDDLDLSGKSLLIISIDTLRADRLGAYGSTRGLTPNLDRLASQGVLFESCYANSPKTASSHMSLFTSMLPTAHGVTNFSPRQAIPMVQMAKNRITLGQVLRRAGYLCATVASGGNIQAEMGFQRGFGSNFRSGLRDIAGIVADARTYGDAFRKPGQRDKSWFMFMHTYQVHGPYTPPAEWRERFGGEPRGKAAERMAPLLQMNFAQGWRQMHDALWDHKEEFGAEDGRYLASLYDAEVAYTDDVLGDFLDWLDETGLGDRCIVVVLSDHGEEFFEHGDWEHDQLHEEHLRVPLIMRLPGRKLAGTRVKGLCSLIDVMPTLLDLLGIAGPQQQMAGRSLVPAMFSGRTANEPVISERVMYADAYQASRRDEASRVIFHAASGCLQAFDLRADPLEQQDLSGTPVLAKVAPALRDALAGLFGLRATLDAVEAGVAAAPPSADTLEELTQLGYVDGGDPSAAGLPSGGPLQSWPDPPVGCPGD